MTFVVLALRDELVLCEIAGSRQAQARGLQGRAPLADGEGMIFPFESTREATFHMGSVAFPIDMVFLDKDGCALKIVTAETGSRERWTATCDTVLEVPAGFCARAGFGVGDAAVLVNGLENEMMDREAQLLNKLIGPAVVGLGLGMATPDMAQAGPSGADYEQAYGAPTEQVEQVEQAPSAGEPSHQHVHNEGAGGPTMTMGEAKKQALSALNAALTEIQRDPSSAGGHVPRRDAKRYMKAWTEGLYQGLGQSSPYEEGTSLNEAWRHGAFARRIAMRKAMLQGYYVIPGAAMFGDAPQAQDWDDTRESLIHSYIGDSSRGAQLSYNQPLTTQRELTDDTNNVPPEERYHDRQLPDEAFSEAMDGASSNWDQTIGYDPTQPDFSRGDGPGVRPLARKAQATGQMWTPTFPNTSVLHDFVGDVLDASRSLEDAGHVKESLDNFDDWELDAALKQAYDDLHEAVLSALVDAQDQLSRSPIQPPWTASALDAVFDGFRASHFVLFVWAQQEVPGDMLTDRVELLLPHSPDARAIGESITHYFGTVGAVVGATAELSNQVIAYLTAQTNNTVSAPPSPSSADEAPAELDLPAAQSAYNHGYSDTQQNKQQRGADVYVGPDMAGLAEAYSAGAYDASNRYPPKPPTSVEGGMPKFAGRRHMVAQHISDLGSYVAGLVEGIAQDTMAGGPGLHWRPEALTAGKLESTLVNEDDVRRWVARLNVAGGDTVVDAVMNPMGLRSLGDGLVLAGIADLSRVINGRLALWRAKNRR